MILETGISGRSITLLVRIGIFGAGAMARTHIQTYAALKGARAAGVSWARRESLRNFEKEFRVPVFNDPDALLGEVDAVDICLPTPLHEQAVLRAARAGKHVLCEKPLALDLAAAGRMIKACRQADVILMAAHCLRFWPEYVFLKDVVSKQKYGPLLEMSLERYSSFPAWGSRGWFADAARSGGAALDLHIHDADMILFLLGAPRAVSARQIATPTCDAIHATYDFGTGGPLVSAGGGWILEKNYPFHQSCRAVFESAVIEFDSRLNPALTVYKARGKPQTPRLSPRDGYYHQLKHFIHCVRNGAAPATSTGENARDALALVLAEKKSAQEKKKISINL